MTRNNALVTPKIAYTYSTYIHHTVHTLYVRTLCPSRSSLCCRSWPQPSIHSPSLGTRLPYRWPSQTALLGHAHQQHPAIPSELSTHTYTHIHIRIHTHTYRHTYIYTHIHTRTYQQEAQEVAMLITMRLPMEGSHGYLLRYVCVCDCLCWT